jgi:transposase
MPKRMGRLSAPDWVRSFRPASLQLPNGALAVIRYAQKHGTTHRPWLTSLLARRPAKVAAIALANKLARMAWAIMAKGEAYREPVALAR